MRGRWLLVLLGWFSAAYFAPRDPGWNVNSRLALVYAVVDEHRLTIDSFHERPGYATGDKAFFDGHFYSDKVIGNALFAVPPYQVARWLTPALSPEAKRWVCTAFTVGLAFGLLLALMAHLIERLGAPPRQATLLAALSGFGTMLFPYATILMPYVPGCLLLMLGYRLTLAPTPEEDLGAVAPSRLALAGLCLGLSVLFDVLFAPAAAAVLLHVLLSQSRARGVARGLGLTALSAFGAFAGIAPQLVYSLSVFGSLSLPYEYEHDPFFREAMAGGLMGIHWPPDPRVLWLITFHPFRGLFFLAPLLLAALPGSVALARGPHGLPRAVMAVALSVVYLLLNAGYRHQWWGGWACGPRLLLPAVPFLLLAASAAWITWRAARPLILILAAVSIGIQLLAAGIDPQPPTPVPAGDANLYLMQATLDQWYPNPVRTVWLPRLSHGEVAWSLGTALGLRGWVSWLPLLLVWAVAAAVWLRRPAADPDTVQS